MTLAELRKLALAATPGPWYDEYRRQDGYSVWSDDGMRLVAGYASTFDKMNAKYIAALSPERVLQLLACVEAADWTRKQLTGYSAFDAYDRARAKLDADAGR